jgi:aspartyl protease family protein
VKLSFMFDTGASLVVLRAEDAGKLGFDVETLAWSATVQTANGPARAAPVTLKALTIGDITERNLRALVAKRGALGENLLGQSFLERLAAYGVEGDLLTLKAKPAQ